MDPPERVWVLDGTSPRLGDWDEAYAQRQRQQHWLFKERIGQVEVSTVFLFLDHQYGDGPPILFETMVFGAPAAIDGEYARYATYAEALRGHARMVERVRAFLARTE